MHIDSYSFGTIRIDGKDYSRDVVLQLGCIADKDQFQVRVAFETGVCRAHNDLGAEVAAHGIE